MAKEFTAFTLLAEDVRIEVGNKHTIIGTLSADMNVTSFPANIKIASYTIFRFKSDGVYEVDIQILVGGIPVAGGKSALEAKSGEPAILVIPAGLLMITEPTDLQITASVDGARKTTLVKSAIRIGDVSVPAPSL